VRRHPDIKWLRRPDDFAALGKQQAAMVDALWPTLAVGGKLLYATCSIMPEENRQQVDAFLARHADAKLVKSNKKPGTNVSGTSDLTPVAKQMNLLKELIPNAKKVAMLYCSAEANSLYQIQLFEAALDKDGIAYKEYAIADTNEVQSVTTAAAGECDVLYIPTDNTLASVTETVYNVVAPAKVPVIAGEEGICNGCGVATLSISYYDLGYATGEMAYEILAEGADITTMDVRYAPNVTKKYNAKICEELGITVPDDYVAIQ
jgi:putative ABC transport system substrate-binding protein